MYSPQTSSSFWEGFYLLLKNIWNAFSVYWLQTLILIVVIAVLVLSFRAAKVKKEPPGGMGGKILRGFWEFLISIFRFILQSPLLILFVVVLVFFRSPKLSEFFIRFLKGLGIPVKEDSGKTEFEAHGQASDKEEIRKIIKEGKRLLIPPVAPVKEVSLKDLKEELRGKITYEYKKVPSTYVYHGIFIPDLGKNFTLPMWVRYQDILAVVRGDKNNKIVVFVRPQVRPTQAKKEWDALVANKKSG